MELIPGFGRPELTGTYFGIFYVVSGVAAALGNTAVGWAMDTGRARRTRVAAVGLLRAVRAGLGGRCGLAASPRRAAAAQPRTAVRRAEPTHELRQPAHRQPRAVRGPLPRLRTAGRPVDRRTACAATGPGPRVLDMGCGTGRDAAALHEAGRTVTGADLSEAMLAHARAHHPGPEYVRADLHGFDLGRCAFDAVVCLDSSLLYCHTQRPARRLPRLLPPRPRAGRPAGRGDAQRRVLPGPHRPARPAGRQRVRLAGHGLPVDHHADASTAPPNSSAAPACGRPTTAHRPSNSTPPGGCCSRRNCGTSSPRTASRCSNSTTAPARAPNPLGGRASRPAPPPTATGCTSSRAGHTH